MRTIVDLPEENIQRLDVLKEVENTSRAELIRRAVDEYLKARTSSLTEGPSVFGLWAEKEVDGLSYQEALRQEW